MENSFECKGPIKLSYSRRSVKKCAIVARAQYYCIQSQVKKVEDRIAVTEKDLRKLMQELHELNKEERYQSLIVCILSDLLHDRHISVNDEVDSGGVIDLLSDPSSSGDEEVEESKMSNHVAVVSKVVTPLKNSPKNNSNEAIRRFSRDNKNALDSGMLCISGAQKEIDCCTKFDNVVSLKRNADDVSEVSSKRMNTKFRGDVNM